MRRTEYIWNQNLLKDFLFQGVSHRWFLPIIQGFCASDQSQRFLQQHVTRGVAEVLLAADHVADAHVLVVDDDGEVVRRVAVGLHDDEVVHLGDGGAHVAGELVVDHDVLAIRKPEPDHVGAALLDVPTHGRVVELQRGAVVPVGPLLGAGRRAGPWLPALALGSGGVTLLCFASWRLVYAAAVTPGSAVAHLASDLHPIDDVRSTAAYRRSVAENLVREFLAGELGREHLPS